jgi:hypothetical protein
MKTKDTQCVSFGLFIGALFAILLVSVLANLWIRVVNNLAYNYFRLNQDSFWWASLVAIIATGIFVGYVFLAFDNETSNALRTRIVGISGGGGGAAAANVSNISNIEPNDSDINQNGIPDNLENMSGDNSGGDVIIDN